ncbi:MAG: tetratricopeptide repeat protein [Isosphaeraceae bacterium]
MGCRLGSSRLILATAPFAILTVSFSLSCSGGRDNSLTATDVQEAMARKDWPRAQRLLDRLTQIGLPDRDLVALKAELELGRGQPERAIQILLAVPDSEPHAAACRQVAGQIERRRDRLRPAEAHFLDALRLNGRLLPARRELILIYGMQARRRELNEQFRALGDIEPLKYDDVLLWTASLEDIWNNDTIEGDLRRYLAADPDDQASRRALATVLLRAGRLEEAAPHVERLPEGDVEGSLLKAQLAMSRGDLDQVRSLAAGGPRKHVGFAKLRGMLAARSGALDDAIEEYRAALALDPTDREANQGLSLALRQAGKRQEADALAKKADLWRSLSGLLVKARGPQGRQDRELLRQLGETCKSLGRDAEAVAWFRLVLVLDPLDEAAQRAIYRLTNRPGAP